MCQSADGLGKQGLFLRGEAACLSSVSDSIEEDGIAQVLLGIRHTVVADGEYTWYGQSLGRKMAREVDECAVLVEVSTGNVDNGLTVVLDACVDAVGALLWNRIHYALNWIA